LLVNPAASTKTVAAIGRAVKRQSVAPAFAAADLDVIHEVQIPGERFVNPFELAAVVAQKLVRRQPPGFRARRSVQPECGSGGKSAGHGTPGSGIAIMPTSHTR
jgi:hypothetical protein